MNTTIATIRTWMCCAVGALFVGCANTEKPRTIHTVGPVTGPDAPAIVQDVERIVAGLGMDHAPVLGLIDAVVQTDSPVHGTNPQWGPYTCTDDIGCFHGVTKWRRSGTYEMEWPKDRKRGLVTHETAHMVFDMLAALGYLDHKELRQRAGHPEFVTLRRPDGTIIRRVHVPTLIDWRWPALLSGKPVWQDPWRDFPAGRCGTSAADIAQPATGYTAPVTNRASATAVLSDAVQAQQDSPLQAMLAHGDNETKFMVELDLLNPQWKQPNWIQRNWKQTLAGVAAAAVIGAVVENNSGGGGGPPPEPTEFNDTDKRGSTSAKGFDRCEKRTDDNESGSGKRTVVCEKYKE